MDAIIIEQGNGFPKVGAYVIGEGQLYRVTEISSTIHTGNVRGNYVHAQVEAADWSDYADGAEHSARVEVAS